MENKSVQVKADKVQTTIGDLIEAIMQVASEAGKTQQESYKLTAATLESILNRQRLAGSVLHQLSLFKLSPSYKAESDQLSVTAL